ncbi:MAG: hypothetical protein Q4E05_00475 [Pseudoclavibacter sp.]|nr:hypothetical protein [Pseudoclavibacter sp.]
MEGRGHEPMRKSSIFFTIQQRYECCRGTGEAQGAPGERTEDA